jgi:hypothetical protein
VLVVEFECDSDNVGSISLDFVFGSYEYNKLAPEQPTKHNDVGGIFLNGELPSDNIATFADGRVVSVNTITTGDSLFAGNAKTRTHLFSPPLISGYTKLLVAEGRTTKKVNIIRIGVVDVNDDSVDSFMFVREGSLQCNEAHAAELPAPTMPPTPLPTPRCVVRGRRCRVNRKCCGSQTCINNRCGGCQKLDAKCKAATDCCSATEDDVVVICKNRKCRARKAAKKGGPKK